jgi:hypothetical protein
MRGLLKQSMTRAERIAVVVGHWKTIANALGIVPWYALKSSQYRNYTERNPGPGPDAKWVNTEDIAHKPGGRYTEALWPTWADAQAAMARHDAGIPLDQL